MRTTQTILLLVVLLLTLGTPLTRPGYQNPPVTIPVDITSYGGIVVQTQINNSRPLSFWLDSGSTSPFVIGLNKANALGLNLQGHISGGGGAGPNTYAVSKTGGLTIKLNDLTFANQGAAVMSLGVVEEQFGRSVDGLVGLDLFLKYVVEIDYAGKELRLADPKSYVYSGSGESLPLTLQDGHFFVPASIAIPERGELRGRFLLDTGGCMMSAILTTPFARKNRLPAATQKTIFDRSVSGLGGETRLLVGRASSFDTRVVKIKTRRLI